MGREFDFADLRRSTEPMMSLRDPRRSVFLHATIAADGVAPTEGRVRNISRGGVMAECRFSGGEGDRVALSLRGPRGMGDLVGSVAWASEDRIGVAFDEPIDPDKVLRRSRRGELADYTPRAAPKAWRPALHCA